MISTYKRCNFTLKIMRQVGWHTIVSFAELLFPLVECLPPHALAAGGGGDTVRKNNALFLPRTFK